MNFKSRKLWRKAQADRGFDFEIEAEFGQQREYLPSNRLYGVSINFLRDFLRENGVTEEMTGAELFRKLGRDKKYVEKNPGAKPERDDDAGRRATLPQGEGGEGGEGGSSGPGPAGGRGDKQGRARLGSSDAGPQT